MFENPTICDQFLNYWRSTGNQRIGIMFGRYEPHKDIPLGIRAIVSAIYEPPQVMYQYLHLYEENMMEQFTLKRCDMTLLLACLFS